MPNSKKKQSDSGVIGKISDYASTISKSYKKWDKLTNAPARTPESGQFWGAVLQNRKYDKNGKIIGKTK